MKKSTLLFISLFTILLGFGSMFGQSKTTIKSSFVIHGTNLNQTDVDFYTKSIEVVDLEKYRAKTSNVFLEFKNQFSLELISAEKLIQSGESLNVLNYTDVLPADFRYPLFKIDESGILVTMYKTKTTKLELNKLEK